MEFALLAAASSASGLFTYNRKNFQFDNDLSMEKTFQGMEMKIKQFELYREDVRDLVELTVRKMDNYLIVNTLQLGFAITMFTEGRPEPEEAKEQPAWLLFLWTVCNLASFMYYLLSMWLAMHASVAAHSFGVRLLTQFVRLPVPNSVELDQARALSKDYESQNVKELFRIPLWKQQMSRLQKQMESLTTDEIMPEFGDTHEEDMNSNPVARLEHIQQFRRLQANWQSYDAYARVSMALGTNMTMMAFSYYCLGLLTVHSSVPWSALSCVVIFTTCSWVLVRLDLYLSRTILAVAGFLLTAPPILALVCTTLFHSDKHESMWYKGLVPVIFALHVLWAGFCLAIAKADHMTESVALPTKFRSVLYLDVFGWLRHDTGHPDDADLADGGMRMQQPRVGHVAAAEESRAQAGARDAPSASLAPLPQVAARLLVGQCQTLQAELEQEIACWEEPQSVRMMKEQPQLLAAAQQHRARLNQIEKQFREVKDGLQITVDQPTTGAKNKSPTWLKLQWSQNGNMFPYFYNRVTQGTWMPQNEQARPGDGRVSDLDRIGLQLELLVDNVSALMGGGQQPSSRGPISVPDSQQSSQPEAERHTFHPGRDVSSHIQRRPVGRMPWHTFFQGSLVLITVWILATIWAIVYIVTGSSILNPPEQEHLRVTTLNPNLVVADDWPHAFFRPSSLTCNPNSGVVGLVAESYAVHEVQLDKAELFSGNLAQTAINKCFTEARTFIGHGLASVSLRCPESSSGNNDGSACSALFLSGDGQSILECNFASGKTERVLALGGKWRALAAGEADTVWVIGKDALVQLRPSAEGGHKLMPQFDLPFRGASNLIDLHVHGQNWLLGIEANGFMHAWPLTGGARHAYRLPKDVKWSSACSTADALFLTGLKKDGKAGVWSLDLPSRLARAHPAHASRWMRWFVAR